MAEFQRVLDQISSDGARVFLSREHPGLRSMAQRAHAAGVLYRVLPGTYLACDPGANFELRAFALCRRYPDAILTGISAAMLTFWKQIPHAPTELVTATCPVRVGAYPGYKLQRRRIPPELVEDCGAIRYTSPAFTALDLCDTWGGQAIDELLRSRQAGLAELADALAAIPGRRGNRLRRQLLLESRDLPWSEAERLAHKLLRRAGLTGWRANHQVRINGQLYYIDIAFPSAKLAIEIDGREHHGTAVAFEHDRARQNRLTVAGWTVLRFTWSMLCDDPNRCIADIRRALRRAA